jgi:hypothetical protein
MTGRRSTHRTRSAHRRRQAFVGFVRTFLEGFVGLPTT